MNISIIAFGTRGDVQPLLALGKTLRRKGHSIRMIAGSNFRQVINDFGLEAADSHVDIQSVMDQADDWLKHGNNPMVNMRVMRKLYLKYGREMAEDAWKMCQVAEMVIGGMLSEIYAVSIAEKVQAKYVNAMLQPSMVATRSGPATLAAPIPNRDSWINHLTTRLLVESFTWKLYGEIANRFRVETLGLLPQSRQQNQAQRLAALTLHGYSTAIIPHPCDWPVNFYTTGYWFQDEKIEWQPPQALLQFLQSGSTPVAIGFGSMAASDALPLARLCSEAVSSCGERAILLSGWSDLEGEGFPDTIFSIEEAPHEWLFPRLKAVVHHGGAGTTAASLRAGIPTIVVPHLADQAFWGKRVELLGAGPRAIPRQILTAPALASAIHAAATDERMKQNAKMLGEKIRAEDGLGNALKLIENEFSR